MKIEDAIGTETFPQDLIIRSIFILWVRIIVVSPIMASVEGCTIHKKTLSERDKHQSTPVKQKKKLRSHKQRVGSVIII